VLGNGSEYQTISSQVSKRQPDFYCWYIWRPNNNQSSVKWGLDSYY